MFLMFMRMLLFLIIFYFGVLGLSKLYDLFVDPKTDKKLDKKLNTKKESLDDLEAKNRTLSQEVVVTKQLNEASKEYASNQQTIKEIEDEL